MGEFEPTMETISEVIQRLLGIGKLGDLVTHYLSGPPATGFAGRLFDQLGDNPREAVVPDDLVAVSLLDVRFGPGAVRSLLSEEFLNDDLSSIPTAVDLWEASEDDLEKLKIAYERLCQLPGVARTKATKLLARKRPRLAPISDSLVEGFYASRGWDHLAGLAEALRRNPDLVSRIQKLDGAPIDSRVTELRLLDVAIWMTRSNATAAKKARLLFLGSPDRA